MIRRFDYFAIRTDHLAIGMKGLVDALKVRTTGRRNRLYLHYFGAIVDDGPGFVEVECEQEVVDHPGLARVRLQVLPITAPTPSTANRRVRRTAGCRYEARI